ncbi:MAG: hypothetical protein IPM89_02530 [Candidatus Competibacteraceae bacterium]|nr:MAG: hypothetical protein IPM89_02530 [Candidatus Competibacteraceae bacterium]
MKSRIFNWRLIVITIVVFEIIYRAPYLFSNPRFWAEEGRYFYKGIYFFWYEALFSPQQGYYSLFPNLATLLAARLSPLEYAPLITTIAAFIAQLLPYIIILYRLKNRLQPIQQILFCIITLFVVNTGEIWLNTITTQFHLAVAAFIILLANHDELNRYVTLFDRIVLIISGLTGVITCFLLPAFAIRWYLDKSKNLLTLNIILIISCIVQLCYITYTATLGSGVGNRFFFPGLASIIKTWQVQFLLWPILGSQWKEILGAELLGGSVAISILLIALSTATHMNRQYSIPIIIAFLTVSILSLVGSLGMGGGWRYGYVPAVILLSLFVIGTNKDTQKLHKILSWFIISLSVGFWVSNYREALKPWVVPDGPVWMEEVQMWRKNPNRPLQIYPQWERAKWHIKLH